MFWKPVVILLCCSLFGGDIHYGISALKVIESPTRDFKLLDGIWNFKVANRSDPDIGFRGKWYTKSLQSLPGGANPMPVPASYNDITQSRDIRDHVGWVWYDREFVVPFSWNRKDRVVLRFESVHYYGKVWVNGRPAMEHEGGHLPFEDVINELLDFDGPNWVTVAVNNTLTPFTLPCGNIIFQNDTRRYPPGYFTQKLIFDFFNYAGIHRSVKLYSTPKDFIADIRITPNISAGQGIVKYTVRVTSQRPLECFADILDKERQIIASSMGCNAVVKVENPNLWWPIGMNDSPGYLYTMKVNLQKDGKVVDIYNQKFGIRTVTIKDTSLLVNGVPVYLKGFGRHEDFHIIGKGFNLPLIVKDFNLMKWMGANSFRTSHYPYAEEQLEFADENGFMVIDESPAVGLHQFPTATLEHHIKVMYELVSRDFNHPSVIMWSVANEPTSPAAEAEYYFSVIISRTKSYDSSRPVTFVIGGSDASRDKAAKFVDVLCVNNYFGWYSDTGHLELIQRQLINDTLAWSKKFRKPLIYTEYGADTVAGIHTMPSFIFSEEYQVEFMHEYHKAFDQLRSAGVLAGEMVWNFADFMTDEAVNRVWGNRKGIFTRERQPKMAAHLLRNRYRNLSSYGHTNGRQVGGNCQRSNEAFEELFNTENKI